MKRPAKQNDKTTIEYREMIKGWGMEELIKERMKVTDISYQAVAITQELMSR